jgi:hypothetical protein
MSTRVAKLVPIGVVAGAMGYFCWSHFDAPAVMAPPAKAAAKTPELTAALLSPPAAPDLERDPFAPPTVEMPPEPAPRAPDKQAKATTAPGAPATVAQGNKPRQPGAPVQRIEGLVLSGTYVRGKRRMAVINGLLYSEGEQITPVGPTAVTASVARVEVDRVIVSMDGRHAELAYASHESPTKDTPARASIKAHAPAVHPGGDPPAVKHEAPVEKHRIAAEEPPQETESDVHAPASGEKRKAAADRARELLEATH